jgi:hypothetical protein
MPIRNLLISATFAVTAIFASSAMTTKSAYAKCTVIDPQPPLNVRATPNGRIVSGLQRGDQVTITKQGANGWVHIAARDGTPLGWVYSRYLDCDNKDASPSGAAEHVELQCGSANVNVVFSNEGIEAFRVSISVDGVPYNRWEQYTLNTSLQGSGGHYTWEGDWNKNPYVHTIGTLNMGKVTLYSEMQVNHQTGEVKHFTYGNGSPCALISRGPVDRGTATARSESEQPSTRPVETSPTPAKPIISKPAFQLTPNDQHRALSDWIHDAEEKGPEYAKSSGTSWTIHQHADEMDDMLSTTITSTQVGGLDNAVEVDVTGHCLNKGHVQFLGLAVDASTSKATIAIPDLHGRVRINDWQVISLEFSTQSYGNQLVIAEMWSAGVDIPVSAIWRWIAEIETDKGPVRVRIPLFDPAVQAFISACNGK